MTFDKWFTRVYEDKYERLFRYAYSITKNKQHAEESVSEVFLNIWQNGNHKNIKELDAYLFISVKHAAIRQNSQNPEHFNSDVYNESNDIATEVNPEHILLGSELEKLLEELTKELPPHMSLTFDLIKNKGYSKVEVSKELGISVRTVEAHLYTAMKKLKDQLEDHFKEVPLNRNRSSFGIVTLLFAFDLINNALAN